MEKQRIPIRQKIEDGLTFMDGGMGTQLQERGLGAGELPETWNLSHPEDVRDVHLAYYAAGSHVVTTNTFGAAKVRLEGKKEIVAAFPQFVRAAIDCANEARRVADERMPDRPHYVALDVGPLGRLIEPFGDLAFEDAVGCFGELVRTGVAHGGIDAILIETMSDCAETRAALLAAKEEGQGLPVFVTNAYGARGTLLSGTPAESMAELLGSMGAEAAGLNCSLGPREMLPVVRRLVASASAPVLVSPNAGLPVTDAATGTTHYAVTPEEFAAGMAEIVRAGARLIGGCCGTTPAHIRAMVDAAEKVPLEPVAYHLPDTVTSRTRRVSLSHPDGEPIVVGECINPSGRPALAEAIRTGDTDVLLDIAEAETDDGAEILDVNVSVGDGREAEHMREAVTALQTVISAPLMLDSSHFPALEAGLRVYHGRAVINSTTGRENALTEAVRLARKYGAMLVGLTMDEGGIPPTAQGRYAVAARIVETAEREGLDRSQLLIDTLCLPDYLAEDAREVTLDAARMVRERLGVRTLLGISNASFGMRDRRAVNASYLSDAVAAGVDLVIINPSQTEMG